MGLLTGFVYAALRYGLALLPGTALYWPVRKFAASVALAAGFAYLLLSGGNVATERAFIMVAVMFAAVLADRRAITIRSVAAAALVVLAMRPEALYGPGFQMSFAATTALVATYDALRKRNRSPALWPFWMRLVGGVALSSLVAGLATAPFAAAHFNQVPHYGLVANIVSVPLMGAVIIPAAVLAALLAPFGLAWIGLGLMKWPILWILAVAGTVADWPGAVSMVVSPEQAVLPLLAFGGLWLAILRGPVRMLGLAVAALGFLHWSQAERPLVLVSQSGGLVGVMTSEGRALSKPRGDGFAADTWLENDGDPASQEDAAVRAGIVETGGLIWLKFEGLTILHATGKKAAAEAVMRCDEAAIVVVNVKARARSGCRVYDHTHLNQTGSLAIDVASKGPRVVTARERSGVRLWSQ